MEWGDKKKIGLDSLPELNPKSNTVKEPPLPQGVVLPCPLWRRLYACPITISSLLPPQFNDHNHHHHQETFKRSPPLFSNRYSVIRGHRTNAARKWNHYDAPKTVPSTLTTTLLCLLSPKPTDSLCGGRRRSRIYQKLFRN